jgi:indole-3-glycerol phosphate synthase
MTEMGVLNDIINNKRSELPALRALKLPPAPSRPPAVDLRRQPGQSLHFICEIKLRSPSAGPLSTRLSVAERARSYEQNGAHMVSVLCDAAYFDGSYEHLRLARSGCALPLLCKEFVVDECQLDAAYAFGASAVLLIARCLSPTLLTRLMSAAHERQLTPLVEVYTEQEARLALDSGATFIGVNARDLDSLDMDAERAERIIESMPPSVVVAHLSGVKSPQDVRRIASGRADAALMGEVLMRRDDPAETLGELVSAAL